MFLRQKKQKLREDSPVHNPSLEKVCTPTENPPTKKDEHSEDLSAAKAGETSAVSTKSQRRDSEPRAEETPVPTSTPVEIRVPLDPASLTGSTFTTALLGADWVELLAECEHRVLPLLQIKPPVVVYGRACRQQRNVGFFSDDSVGYSYSGQRSASIPLVQPLRVLLTAINHVYHTSFNGVLVNHYTSGADYLSAHSDDERYLSSAQVVGISVGATRLFRIRDKRVPRGKATRPIVADVHLVGGTLYRMRGPRFQSEFTHEIPVQKKVSGSRLSFTFRQHAR
jgi:alkylated DNA repair dioxygenase AlkB